MLVSVCSLKQFRLGGKWFADDEEVEMEVRKWLRQQLEDFCAACFDALVMRWNKCVSVGGAYVEKLFLVSNITLGSEGF
jgi:hypothetical protein